MTGLDISPEIKSLLLLKTLIRLNYERGLDWTMDDLELTLIRTDTVTGVLRLIVDAIAPARELDCLRVYLYSDGVNYEERIAVDPQLANNTVNNRLFVHTSAITQGKFTKVHTYLTNHGLLNVPLRESPGMLGSAVWDPYTYQSWGGVTRSCSLMKGTKLCILKYGGPHTGDGYMTINMTGPNNAMVYPIVSSSIQTPITAVTGCVCDGKVMTTSKDTGKLVSINMEAQLGYKGATGVDFPIRCLRTDPDGTRMWLLTSDGETSALWSVDPVTLIPVPEILQAGGTSVEGLPISMIVTATHFFIATHHAVYSIDRLTHTVTRISQAWLGATAHPSWGDGYQIGTVIWLKSGRLFTTLSLDGVVRYGVEFTTDGGIIGAPMALPDTIDSRVKPVEFMENRVVLMNIGLQHVQVNVVELDLNVRRYVIYSEADDSAVDISLPCLSIDGNIFIGHSALTNLAFLSRDPALEPIDVEWRSWTTNPLVNNF